MKIPVKIVQLDKDLPLPSYATDGSAGCDVRAAQGAEIPPGERRMIPIAMRMEIPEGFECQVRPRSGLALKHGITVANAPATIDSDFRGEMHILLVNLGQQVFRVERGDRIAQFVFAPVTKATFEVVDELSPSGRGEGGWGHSGTQ